MSTYLAYVTTGQEFAVADKLAALGFDLWCGREIIFVRKGKRRRPEPVERPKLPNYLWLNLEPEEWHDLRRREVKHLAGTMYQLSPRDLRGSRDWIGLNAFRAAVDAAYAEGQRIARNNDLAEMAQFERGQQLIDLTGTFGETCLRFRRMVERAHELYPKVEAEMEMFGRTVRVELDPLDVRAAE